MPSAPTRLLLLAALLAPIATLQAQPATPPPIPSEIEVDGTCRIITLDLRNPAQPRLRYHRDAGICHLESINASQHWETTIRNGVTKRILVDVREHEFVLLNPYPQPISFLVKQPVLNHFHIDSDPQPNDVTNSVATFRVFAQPNETIHLHVGQRD